MITFQYPYMFLLVLLPFAAYFLLPGGSDEKSGLPSIYNPNLKWLAKAYGRKGISSHPVAEFNIYLYLIWLMLVLALMHPQRIEQIAKRSTKGYDIMLAIDLSRSMEALDFADFNNNDMKNRLDVVKGIAADFIRKRNGDRLGLILFGTSAYMQTPLTLDTSSVATMLNLSDIGMAGDATAIGDALALSIKALMQRPEGSRIIILLTDGANTAGQVMPLEAARLAKSYGIKIYSIAVGQKGAVPYPTELGIVYARINTDETTLKKISEITGGAFFSATDETSLAEIYRKIDELEKTEAEASSYILRQQLYRIPLGIAMLMLMAMIMRKYNWSKVLN